MKIAVLTEPIPAQAAADRLDTREEATFVERTLRESGHTVAPFEFRLGEPKSLGFLVNWAPDLVFNLVESVDDRAELIHLPPAILESFGIPTTGVPSSGIQLTSHKILAKSMMNVARIPTPQWQDSESFGMAGPTFEGPYIVKPASEDASIGIEETSFAGDLRQAIAAIRRLKQTFRGEIFVEKFIDGRELNLSMLERSSSPLCLPLAEIDFVDWDITRPKIVGYRAKWDSESSESKKTVRRFIREEDEASLCLELQQIGRACWKLFGLRGFARVDFRVDEMGRPWVLEVNANPCISPEAGFMAAAHQAGLSPQDVMEHLVQTGLQRKDTSLSPAPSENRNGDFGHDNGKSNQLEKHSST